MLVLPEVLIEVASTQFGLLAERQLLAEITPHQMRQLKAGAVLLPTLDRGVCRLAGAPRSFRQRATGLLLNRPGLVVSHLAAEKVPRRMGSPRREKESRSSSRGLKT